jgi:hypothetical protein
VVGRHRSARTEDNVRCCTQSAASETEKIRDTMFQVTGYQKNINTHLKLLPKKSQVTCCVTQLATVWFFYSESRRSKDLILNMCSHEDHMHTDCP